MTNIKILINKLPEGVCKETWKRIKIAVAAYAYEFENDPIMSDADFDELASLIDLNIDTGNKLLDKFFREEFDEITGQWIHKHPELEKIRQLYITHYAL